jgi:hypothetical protein
MGVAVAEHVLPSEPIASLVDEPQNRLLELGNRSRRSDDGTAEPHGEAKAEAPAVSDSTELLDLIDERLLGLAVAVQRATNIVDVAFHQCDPD